VGGGATKIGVNGGGGCELFWVVELVVFGKLCPGSVGRWESLGTNRW